MSKGIQRLRSEHVSRTTVMKMFWPILNLSVKKNAVQARGFLASCLSPCGSVMNDGPQAVHRVLSSVGGPVPEEDLSEWFAVMSRFTLMCKLKYFCQTIWALS